MNKKAIVLLSGGLDSSIALKLVQEQGIECIGVKFASPFCTCDSEDKCNSKAVADQFNIKFLHLPKGVEFLEVVKNPAHGWGRGINPCIDCRIYILKKAKELMKEHDASFVVTGEVLGQRPMSQHRKALATIEKESGLEGLILRPLSAKYFPKTKAEEEGIIDISKFPAIEGRRRNVQFELSKKFNIEDYSCPGGGCLLTEEIFAVKMIDLFSRKSKPELKDVILLKKGRHLVYKKSKVVSGRNKSENESILALKDDDDIFFQVEGGIGSVVLLQGEKNEDTIGFAAKTAAYYADSKEREVVIIVSTGEKMRVVKPAKDEIEPYNLVYRKLERKDAERR